MQTEEVQIKHRLSDKEIAGLAREQSAALNERSSLEDELISVKKMYASKQAEADAKVSRISLSIAGGWEMRNVRCMIADERLEGFRLTIRLDTGHIVRRRKLEQHERQISLTTEQPQPFICTALLPVDDEGWEVEACQIPLRQDEFDALRHTANTDGVMFYNDPITPKAMIEGQTEAPKRRPGRPRKN